MDEWQPIETAPWDEVVLAKNSEFGPYEYRASDIMFMDPPPTHWKPKEKRK